MTEPGDIYLADLNFETRIQVLVVSPTRFSSSSGRTLVVPQIPGDPDEVQPPWRIEIGGAVFGVDLLRSIPVDRLLTKVSQASFDEFKKVQRAVRHLT